MCFKWAKLISATLTRRLVDLVVMTLFLIQKENNKVKGFHLLPVWFPLFNDFLVNVSVLTQNGVRLDALVQEIK